MHRIKNGRMLLPASVNHFKLCTKLIIASFFKKLWQHYLPRWIFCPSPKDEIRIRLQLHCPLSRFCTAIVDVSSFSSPFDGAQRCVLTLSHPITKQWLKSVHFSCVNPQFFQNCDHFQWADFKKFYFSYNF